ncbi:hypothetical protein [Halanaeroarchaeum sulfurireducens]|uniref:HEAT repeat domain-containing protein n=1 Tax=Halanaeroarchaeum sulfurireducens TaxID=1604004 RepID=A0A0F7PCU4_9EURY|nr:hypothetical protein [Halanaeroarchaeum sulfurireducens]AKH97454.1 hypothetical protein HLASF_0964 [Halanaeroarchaeum sulfurireducens]ALG81850.1 hypothetical protein HLASA_0953 [Halanaeroarchaeum sulfurireducens]
MDRTPDAFAAALSSGETERVNRAINAVEDMDIEDRAALFDPCFERCRDCFETDDGYRRQSVVRFLSALYPGLGYRAVGDEITDAKLPGDWSLDDAARHRRLLRDFYLEALVDDDGRVRRAAGKAIKELAVAADLLDADDELQSLLSEVEGVSETIDDPAVQKHVDEAYESVVFHAEKPGSLLSDSLRDALE